MADTVSIVWDDPTSIVVKIRAGSERLVTVRQVSARRFHHHVGLVQRIMAKLRELHPEITDWGAVPIIEILGSHLQAILGEIQGEVDGVLASCTDLTADEIRDIQDIPAGAYVDFLLAVADVQRPSLEAFSRARQWWGGLLPGQNGRTGSPSPSSRSSEPASPIAT
jgi:hypothetical protein